MEMTYDGALVMPSGCALMDEDEMTYIDGGAWNSVKNIGKGIDFIILVGGIITGAVGIAGTVKEILRRNVRGVVMATTKKLLIKVGLSAAGFLASSIVALLEFFLNKSLGVGIAMALDRLDRVKGNKLIAF